MPDPLYVPFRGRAVRVRHDDPRLGPYMPMAVVLRSAASLESDVEGLRLVLATTVGAHYRGEMPDDGHRGPAAAAAGMREARPSRDGPSPHGPRRGARDEPVSA